MIKKRDFAFLRIGLWLILLLGIVGCSGQDQNLWLDAPDWSRARLVGTTAIADQVPVAIDGEGGLYTLLIKEQGDTFKPEVIGLDRGLNPVWHVVLDVPLSQPDKPYIAWDGRSLHLFWLSQRRLYTAELDTTGSLVRQPTLISNTKEVNAYSVAVAPDGDVVVWYAGPRRDPGLYALYGEETAVLVDEEGVRPTLRYDLDGNLHASWAHYPPGYEDTVFYYADYPGGAFEPGRETAVGQPRFSTTDILEGPWLGLDRDTVYYIWTTAVRTGPEAGKVQSEYITFPLGEPAQRSEEVTILLPADTQLVYESPARAVLQAGARVGLSGGAFARTPVVDHLATNPNPEEELAVASKVEVLYQYRKVAGQTGVTFLQDGQLLDYQLLSFTPANSQRPFIISDQNQYLYTSWVERFSNEGFSAYLTSTAPDVIEAASRLTGNDLSRLLREFIFGLLSGAVLAPVVVLVWLIVPLLFLAITSFVRSGGEKSRRYKWGTAVTLGAAILLYWVGKLFLLPGIRSYVPFSAWLPGLPNWLQAPLQFGVPVLITIVGIYAAWRLTYGREADSPLYFMFIFAAVDGLLTMAVYGFLIYNVI